jgi:isopropylmalate/homocitrate/citramalate synthase
VITICDVGPRDGLQNDAVVLEPAVRAELATRLGAAGLPRVEVASFVNPRLVPPMAGAEEVVAALDPEAPTVWAALALNRRGLDRAIAAGVREAHFSYSVTDAFGERNQGMGAEAGAAAAAEVVAAAHEAGVRATVTLSCCFGCPFEGRVDPGVVVDHVRRAAAAGADEVLLADTIGVGVPAAVRRLVPPSLEAAAGTPVGLHLHDTRGTAVANADAALEHGITLFDASVGGLGGCPYAPGATGNVATEDLLYLLHESGVGTGVDLDAVIEVAHWLAEVLGRPLPGLVQRAGAFPV